ncbi:MAG: hypothetical protein AMXMBFR59_41950 [Rhodanobacteraceae bacterium]
MDPGAVSEESGLWVSPSSVGRIRIVGVPVFRSGSVVKRPDGLLEVIFMVPEAFDPHSVVDPPDVWVLVDPASGNASLIPIM